MHQILISYNVAPNSNMWTLSDGVDVHVENVYVMSDVHMKNDRVKVSADLILKDDRGLAREKRKDKSH